MELENLKVKIIVLIGAIFVLFIAINTITSINKFNYKVSKDIAREYTDSVNSMIMRQVMNGEKIEGTYKITEDGDLENYIVNISGDSKPKGGFLKISNNIVTEGCLTINNYKIDIENMNIKNIERGKCE